jgi:chemotaxis protein CheX
MSVATLEQPLVESITDPALTKAIITSVTKGFEMCGLKARPVGISRVPLKDGGLITGMIGVHGKISGFVTVNFSETMAIKAVEGLIQDKFGKLTPQVIDGTGEITNIIVGGMKAIVAGSTWGFGQITVPSVIVGNGYQIAFARGLEFVSVAFEIEDDCCPLLDQRIVQVSLSLLRL